MKPSKNLIHHWHSTVYKEVLHPSDTSRLSRLKTRIFSKISQRILKNKDPLVEYELYGFPILIPFSHKLPFILKVYPYYSLNLLRLTKCIEQKYFDLSVIDVGANIGDSVVMLRSRTKCPILCIEGDQNFLPILKHNTEQFENVEIEPCFLGLSNIVINAVSRSSAGTAHLELGIGQDSNIQMRRLSEVIQSHKLFSNAKLLKVDTDGFDCQILKGAEEFILATRPIIFFEYDPFFLEKQGDNDLSIFSNLYDWGYEKALIYDNLGDLMFSVILDDVNVLAEIRAYFSGRNGQRYCDICAFHSEDNDLFLKAREEEIQYNCSRKTIGI
jgi:FkbM family methyltransferase